MAGYCSLTFLFPHRLSGPAFILSSIDTSFFSETTEPVEVRFHVEQLWLMETKVYIIGFDLMTRMAIMPIYNKKKKTFKNHLLKGLEPYKVHIDDDPGLTLAYFTTRSTLFAYAFTWENPVPSRKHAYIMLTPFNPTFI